MLLALARPTRILIALTLLPSSSLSFYARSGTSRDRWEARGEPFYKSSCAAAPLCWGAENGFEVEENGFLDCGSFLEPTIAQDRDAHWTVGQGGVAGPQMN